MHSQSLLSFRNQQDSLKLTFKLTILGIFYLVINKNLVDDLLQNNFAYNILDNHPLYNYICIFLVNMIKLLSYRVKSVEIWTAAKHA